MNRRDTLFSRPRFPGSENSSRLNHTVTLYRGAEDFFRSEGQTDFLRYLKICSAWEEIVGERMARVTRPLKVEFRELQIQVRDSAYADALHRKKHDILGYIRPILRTNDIQKLRFIVESASEKS